jgi:hypothetical protein
VYPACKDKAEIKCIGSVGGKTPTEANLCSLFFSNLGYIEQDKVDVMFNLDMGDRIRSSA